MSTSEPSNKLKHLLLINANQRVEYHGLFELKITNLSDAKWLLVSPKSEDKKPFQVPFESLFIQQKHILCVFSKYYSFSMVFHNEKLCQRIYDIVMVSPQNGKTHTSINIDLPSSIEISDNNLRKRSSRNLSNIKTEEIIGDDEIEDIEGNESDEEYLDEAKFDEISDSENESLDDLNDMDYDGSQSENETFDNINLHKEKSRKQKNVQKVVETKIVRPPNFAFHCNIKGEPKSTLFIFDSKDPSLCYKYSNHGNGFMCAKCAQKKQYCKAKIITNDGEESILLTDFNHVCNLQPYVSEKKEIILKSDEYEFRPNSKGVPDAALIVFVRDNRNLCYKFSWCVQWFICHSCGRKKKRTEAKIKHTSNGEKYVVIKEDDHICMPKIYEPLQKQIIKAPMFELQCNKHGAPKSRLVIFATNEKKFCYNYSMVKGSRGYCLKPILPIYFNIFKKVGTGRNFFC